MPLAHTHPPHSQSKLQPTTNVQANLCLLSASPGRLSVHSIPGPHPRRQRYSSIANGPMEFLSRKFLGDVQKVIERRNVGELQSLMDYIETDYPGWWQRPYCKAFLRAFSNTCVARGFIGGVHYFVESKGVKVNSKIPTEQDYLNGIPPPQNFHEGRLHLRPLICSIYGDQVEIVLYLLSRTKWRFGTNK